MNRIILDAHATSPLSAADLPVELCDPSGKVIGRFLPLIDMNEWEPLSPEVSEEELDRRSKSKGKRYTTAEVIAHLEKL